MNRKSIYATLFLTFLLGIGGQTALAHTGGSDAGYRDNQTAASLIQAGEAEGAKILAAQAETSLLHLDEDDNLSAAVLLIDGATGEIVQAAKAKVLPATSIQGVADQTATTPREGIFNLQGQRLRSLQHGINIVNGKKVLKR